MKKLFIIFTSAAAILAAAGCASTKPSDAYPISAILQLSGGDEYAARGTIRLITEMLNSAAGENAAAPTPEIHPLAAQAKGFGIGAAFYAIIHLIAIWAAASIF